MSEFKEIELKKTAKNLVEQAESFIVSSQETLREANTRLIQCATIEKAITAYWEPEKESAHKTWRGICDKLNEMLKIPKKARGIYENSIREYREGERRKAEEEQRQADAERAKREAEEKARLLKAAEKAQDKGQDEKAAELLEKAEAVFIPPTVIMPTISKTEETDFGSVIGVKDLKIEVVSMRELARAVYEGQLPEHVLEAKTGALKTWAKGNGLKNFIRFGLSVQEVERFQAKLAKAVNE